LKDTDFVKNMDPLYRETQQVNSIWQKLVLTHPHYSNFKDDGMRGWAQKTGEAQGARTLEISTGTADLACLVCCERSEANQPSVQPTAAWQMFSVDVFWGAFAACSSAPP
jgi:hypothetical protein